MIDEKMNYADLEAHMLKIIAAYTGELKRKAYTAGFEKGYVQGENERTTDRQFKKQYEKVRKFVNKHTVQERRDWVIEQAKQDVENLKYGGFYDVKDPVNEFASPYVCFEEFIVNKEKRVVVALLRGFRTGAVYAKGIAKCVPDGCFNIHIGKAIALRRALGKEVPDEYLDAPQPTEVRVGDVVNGNGKSTVYGITDQFEITGINHGKLNGNTTAYYYKGSADDWIETGQIGKVIDDSREEN